MNEIREFGRTHNGQTANLYTLGERSDGLQVRVTDLGATITHLFVPDRSGSIRDVVIGYDSASDYETVSGHAGTLVGRCANRTKGATVTIDGHTYSLGKNDGENNNHSGPDSWHRRIYSVRDRSANALTLALLSPDLDQGFPGNLDLSVTYAVCDNRLEITYRATSDRDTIFNPTNHSYFNLDGHDGGGVTEHIFRIDAEQYTETADDNVPTGVLLSVDQTPYDFRAPKKASGGVSYDLNYAIQKEGFRLASCAHSERSGITMNTYTDLPGFQFYIPEAFKPLGKGGVHYPARPAFCFETQFFPDAIHHPNFASPILRAGDIFESRTVYEFITEGK